MKLYNTRRGIVLFVILFMIWAYQLGNNCPCTKDSRCVRHEFYGVQLNHFVLFIFIGFVFPSHFFTVQALGVLWEFAEFLLDRNPEIVEKYIGGCLKYPPLNHNESENKPWDYVVYRGLEKPLNVIDQILGIKNSKIHGWHGSPAEIVPNLLGFGVGYYLNKFVSSKL